MTSSDDYLPLSGIQHFVFCRRQWALIHVEQQWQENLLTAEGRIQHKAAHDEARVETRGDLIVSRGMRVLSHTLKLQGACDVVEFHRSASGIPLKGRNGLWQPFPIEYKHGKKGIGTQADALQLCCQAICLEEMLLCQIPRGALFYQETRKREEIDLNDALRTQAYAMADEMNAYFSRGFTPKVKPKAGCRSCSLKEVCLPQLLSKADVAAYVHRTMEEVSAP